MLIAPHPLQNRPHREAARPLGDVRPRVFDPRQARIVELRFFGGLSVEEAAEVLGVSPKTVKRDWSVAKAWLYADLKERHGIDAAAMGDRQSAV